MWGTAWGSRPSPRSPNCLNLNLRSFLCCSTNYPCTQLCGVSARRFGWIVPGHPPVGSRGSTGCHRQTFFITRDSFIYIYVLQQVALRHKFALQWLFLLLLLCLSCSNHWRGIQWHITARTSKTYFNNFHISEEMCNYSLIFSQGREGF